VNDDPFPILIGVISGLLLFGAVILGSHLGEKTMREEAVQKGHAEWVADTSGKPKFRWKECK
jgi:hypothetical protein